MKKYLKFLFFIGIFVIQNQVFSQTTAVWLKFSPEVALIKKNFELKFRPCDMTFTPDINIYRVDLSIGYSFKNFKLYEYTKFDNTKAIWTGFKFDYNLFLINKKLLIHLEERYFWGLNNNSTDHYYLVDLVGWQLNKNLMLGYFNYGKWKIAHKFNEGLLFLGPIAIYKLPANWEAQLTFTKNIFDKNTYMLLSKLSYKIKLH